MSGGSLGDLGDSEKNVFSSSHCRFFKIFLEEILGESKLHIPKKFTRKYGETLSNSVLVKLPCGSKWKMELTKKDENIWFEKGWLDFAKHYAIKRGSMISFEYEGNSEFSVVIFDLSTVEIDYPTIPTNLVGTNIDSELKIPKREVVEEDSIETLDVYSSPCSQPHKKMRTQSNLSCRKLESETKGKHNLHHAPTPPTCDILRQMKPSSGRDEVEALQKAGYFKSSRPFFKVVMQPYYVHGHLMNIPGSFAKKYIGTTCSNAILKLSNGCGRTWSVQYKFGVYNKGISSRFQASWRAFVQDNNLRVGDVCVFVMLEDINLTFEVVIFRAGRNSKTFMSPELKDAMDDETVMGSSLDNLSMKQAHRLGKKPPKKQRLHFSVMEKAKLLDRVQFKSENPFFKIVIQPSYVTSRENLNVPSKFAMKHLKEGGAAILSISNGGSWPIQFQMRHVNTRGGMRVECRCGWKEFARDNDLKVGDLCIFELLNKSDNLFRVSIVRAADDSYHQKSQAGATKPKVEVGEEVTEFF
ncbi:B3 domain-containing transcription factor VRN1-like [Humulus lupulus]|uniref:B3 domain-containing transcription factor VRN1-like n=1 Tax=Humulus lupulus TaxID=3486 RepID=UPI002B4073FD|nr:B3 domain-containing transcription factor VRN1-like [Humulus lupulus]